MLLSLTLTAIHSLSGSRTSLPVKEKIVMLCKETTSQGTARYYSLEAAVLPSIDDQTHKLIVSPRTWLKA